MKNKSDLGKLIESLNKEKIIFLIQYGSSLKAENYEDIDLVMIEKEMQGKESMKFAGFDIILEGIGYFQRMINLRDPAYATEPILTGELLIGNEEEFKRIKNNLKENTEADWRYLLRFSIEDYYRAEQFLNQQYLFKSLRVLHFSFSYLHFSKWYLKNDTLISWEELKEELSVESKKLLKKMNSLLKHVKDKDSDLERETIDQFFDLYSSKLLLSSDLIDN